MNTAVLIAIAAILACGLFLGAYMGSVPSRQRARDDAEHYKAVPSPAPPMCRHHFQFKRFELRGYGRAMSVYKCRKCGRNVALGPHRYTSPSEAAALKGRGK